MEKTLVQKVMSFTIIVSYMDEIDFEGLGKVVMKSKSATFIEVEVLDLRRVLTKLRLSGVKRLMTITGVDNGRDIEVIYHFDYDYHIINVKTRIEREDSKIESIITIYSGAKLFERELAEMLDVRIEGNREPQNVFLCEGSPKAPLRKKDDGKMKEECVE